MSESYAMGQVNGWPFGQVTTTYKLSLSRFPARLEFQDGQSVAKGGCLLSESF